MMSARTTQAPEREQQPKQLKKEYNIHPSDDEYIEIIDTHVSEGVAALSV